MSIFSSLAAMGLLVVGVDFRNCGGKLRGIHPFPAGLNDCFSALQWVHAHRTQLRVGKVVLMGEGGGANLCLAVALKAANIGLSHLVAGVYAHCPYIYGKWNEDAAASAERFPSLVENAGYVYGVLGGVPIERLYCKDVDSPLAWPMSATDEELARMPPVMIQVHKTSLTMTRPLSMATTSLRTTTPRPRKRAPWMVFII